MRSKLRERNVLRMRNNKDKFNAIRGNSKINIIIMEEKEE